MKREKRSGELHSPGWSVGELRSTYSATSLMTGYSGQRTFNQSSIFNLRFSMPTIRR